MRRFALGLVVVAAVAVLSGCVPKPTPIVLDLDTEKTTSKAEWRVMPVTTTKGPGIEIRIRNCSTGVLQGGTLENEIRMHLRPVAHVRDQNGAGKVIFSNASPISEVLPAGSKVIDTTTPTTDDLQRIIIPTSAATGGLKIETTCTTYKGYGSGGGFSWGFTPCTTANRSCATRTAGTSVFKP